MAHHTQGSMLDILKKKMRQAKEEMENARDSAEEAEKRHMLEIKRREDVSSCHQNGLPYTRKERGGEPERMVEFWTIDVFCM